MKFSEAFKKARKAGKRVFTWNGKKYNTRRKGETKDQWLKSLGGTKKDKQRKVSARVKRSNQTPLRPKARPKRSRPTTTAESNTIWPPAATLRPQPRPSGQAKSSSSPWFSYTPGPGAKALKSAMSSLSDVFGTSPRSLAPRALSAQPKGNGKQSKYMTSSEYKKLKAKSDRKKRKYGFK